jgi:hypothetical protein
MSEATSGGGRATLLLYYLAVAELGESVFRPVLREFIRGHSMQALQWIGGDSISPNAEQRLHDIHWRVQAVNDVNYLVVRLFSFVGRPQDPIAVGSLLRPVDQLPFVQRVQTSVQANKAEPTIARPNETRPFRRHGRARSGHPRLSFLRGLQDVDARDKRGHDEHCRPEKGTHL